MWRLLRPKKRELAKVWFPHSQERRLGDLGWRLSTGIGYLSVVVLAIVLVALLISNRERVVQRLGPYIPAPVLKFFNPG